MSDPAATPETVKRLAALARVQVPDADLPRFAAEFQAVVAYIGALDGLAPEQGEAGVPAVRNALRTDGDAAPAGAWTERLAAAFPEREGDSLRVKRIISHD